MTSPALNPDAFGDDNDRAGPTDPPGNGIDLEAAVSAVFADGGTLSHMAAGFVPRAAQTAMALAVAQTIAGTSATGDGVLVAEAGTGVGKTFAYLVPALLSGERVLVSTATKTLQDQLFGRDLPRLIAALGLPVRTALLKGRASYLCLHRLQTARDGPGAGDRFAMASLARVERWAQTTRSGDLAEMPGLDERSPVIPLVTSTRENCLGAQCPQYRACHVNLARREALAADLVVVNHHLFFADLAVRESGMAELLPTVRVAVFDEAHQLNETGVQFLGRVLSTGQLLDLAQDLLALGLAQARGLADWNGLAGGVERAARDLRLLVGRAPAGNKLRWTDGAPQGVDARQWAPQLSAVAATLQACAAPLEMMSEIGPDFVRMAERAASMADRAVLFATDCDPANVRWIDVGQQLRLVESPLDIAQAVQNQLLGPERAAPTRYVFTSATLGADDRLSWFTEPCGLGGARIERFGSPFDHARQSAMYVPRDLPLPADPGHPLAVARLAADAVERLGGRTLVLTTSLRALRVIGEHLQEVFAGQGGVEALVQGERPKRVLMERFRQGSADGGRGCVLVASASFWEGVDVPGEALQLVVIDKLPFPSPGDPLVEARARRLEAQGRSPFNDYYVPEAAVTLKQGAGRLIRSETDSGVLAVCDARLVTMGYGRRLLAALPAMRRLADAGEFQAALDALTTASTTGRPCP